MKYPYMKKNENIVIIGRYLSPPQFGVLTRLHYIGKYFHIKNGANVSFIVGDQHHLSNWDKFDNKKAKIDGVLYKLIKLPFKNHFSKFERALNWLIFELKLITQLKLILQAHVIILSTPPTLGIISVTILRKLANFKFILDIRDIWPLTLTEEGNINKKNPLVKVLKLIEKIGFHNCDEIWTPIPNLQLYLNEENQFKKKLTIVPMGYEDIPKANPLFAKLNDFPEKQRIIGYFGSMGPTNNLEQLIKIIIRPEFSSFNWIFVGNGSMKEKLVKLTKGHDHIRWMDRVSRESAQSLILQCDLVFASCMASKIWKYGQSMNKILEYMLLGKTIIFQYPSNGFKTMVNEAKCGFYVDSDSTEQLRQTLYHISQMSDKEICTLGIRGQNWIKRYRHYSVIFENIMSNKI
jgi:glycosyltransferase involved in cell wall biosynthesis